MACEVPTTIVRNIKKQLQKKVNNPRTHARSHQSDNYKAKSACDELIHTKDIAYWSRVIQLVAHRPNIVCEGLTIVLQSSAKMSKTFIRNFTITGF